MAKLLGTPLRGGAASTTRAKDGDRQDACRILDNVLTDGEISDQEHRERVSAATHAITLGDLRSLVDELQTDGVSLQALAGARTLKPPKLSGWGVLAAAFVVSVLLGVGIGWGLYGNTGSPLDFTTDPGAKPDGVGPVVLTAPTEPVSVDGLTGLMEQTRKRFGDTMGFRLVSYPTYAVLDRPDPADDRRMLATTTAADGATRPARPRAPPMVPSRLTSPNSTSRPDEEVPHQNEYLVIEPAPGGAVAVGVSVERLRWRVHRFRR